MKDILLLLLFITSVMSFGQQKFISVTGTAVLIRPADQAEFTVRIHIIDDSMVESKRMADKNLQDLLAILKSTGIDNQDIQVSPVRIGKNYEDEPDGRHRKQKGYFTEINASFTLKDLSKYYELTTRISLNNIYEITRAEYSISDYEAQNKIANMNALKAAKEKADYLANTSGTSLGEVLEIEENNGWEGFPNPYNTMTKENSSGDLSGKVVLRRSVKVKYAIIQKEADSMKTVNGIGGIFFKCKDPEKVKNWYKDNLGFNTDQYGAGFEWRLGDDPSKKTITQWSPFSENTKYFNPSSKDFMINYVVSDLEALQKELKKKGVNILDEIQSYDYGKFLHIMDIEGNKIELWEPNYSENH